MWKLATNKSNFLKSSFRSVDLKVNSCATYFSTWNHKVISKFELKKITFDYFKGNSKFIRSSQPPDTRRIERSI